MPKHSYQLINPIIEGTFTDVFDSNKPIDAANSLWKKFTEHIVSHVPKFMFTLKDISSGDIYHFEVLENGTTNNYTINELNLDIDTKEFDEFQKKVDSYTDDMNKNDINKKDINKNGGGKKRQRYEDDSSSSSSSSDIYPTIRRTSPIAMFHYNTRVYYANGQTYKSTLNPQIVAVSTPVFTPIFRPALGTFVGIWP